MSASDHPSVAELRESLSAQVGSDQPDLAALLRAYLAPIPDLDLHEVDPEALAGIAQAHLTLGRTRAAGRHLVQVLTPTDWDPHGSVIALVISEDQPFLVDTVTLELTRQEWSLRQLYHPQPQVRRDEQGNLLGIGSGEVESWIAVEIYPPLGHSAAERVEGLEYGLATVLDTVTATYADWKPMLARCRTAIAELWSAGSHRRQVTEAVNLLEWLAEDHFVFLGYASYHLDGDRLVPDPGTGLGLLRDTTEIDMVNVPDPGEDDPVILMRDLRRSPVYRRGYLTHLAVRTYGVEGRLAREHRFLGFLGASSYTESVANIPVLAAKSQQLLDGSGFEPDSHGWNVTRQVIATYPRDELFEASVNELAPIVAAVAALQERRQTRVFLRRSRYGGFTTALVYLPRDRYNTTTRVALQDMLLEQLGGDELYYTTLLSESLLTRLFFLIRIDPDAGVEPDLARINELALGITSSWEDGFEELAKHLPAEERGVEFGEAYQVDHSPAEALTQLRLANQLRGEDDLRVTLSGPVDADDPADLRLVVLTWKPMTLTAVMPHLSALGVQTVDERPYEWQLRGRPVWCYSFGMRLASGQDWDQSGRQRFVEAFAASWVGRCEADPLNELVAAAGLDWRQVTWLRAISRYLKQIGLPFSQNYLASALIANPALAAGLVTYFELRFDPDRLTDPELRDQAATAHQGWLNEQFDQVPSLDHDRILRAFAQVITAAVRTNAFLDTAVLALKLEPTALQLLPEPRPEYEIYVYSPRVHGVHLRFGAIARGGLRWSDRMEDFRTEVLGLVKAQLVKNSVIVPSGAKGGFVPQQLPNETVARLAEGRACYELFVDALLSVTDNIVDGAVVSPSGVVCHDGDDPYLVVAADKGTASFSDLANEISLRRGFWLGDAFASGGSSGYDHKKMGITARGAWEAVRRHFTELGRNPDVDEFTCVGIGDLAGDVFGNGMLLSNRMKLVAAFNHQHIFLDPNPDPEVSFAERQRMFALPTSTWADYRSETISAGGGVFSRTLKAIPISDQVRSVLWLEPHLTHLTPNELIQAVLRARVDLLFNGGVGTFVKASTETHSEAGDKANDPLRVDGVQLRASCVAEGGNLGFTQAGRIEFAQAGGRINTDFIDNSAGVDSSDHEVNIKILLASPVANGSLSMAERDALLASMTDEVAGLVLAHNHDQNLALANEMHRRVVLAGQHEAWLVTLTSLGLDRDLEELPSPVAFAERIAAGEGLTRPELAVVLSHTKLALKRLVLETDLPDDPYLADRLIRYFPSPLREPFNAEIRSHRLAREIITTVAVNRFVDSQGITAYHRLSQETGADIDQVIRAQLASRAILNVGLDEVRLRNLGHLNPQVGTELRVALLRAVERCARWLLHHHPGRLDIPAVIATYTDRVGELRPALPGLLRGRVAQRSLEKRSRWLDAGLPEDLVARLSTVNWAHTLLSVVRVAERTGRDPGVVAAVHYRLSEDLAIEPVSLGVDALPRQERWDALARAALRDDLLVVHADLTQAVLDLHPSISDPEELIRSWLEQHPQAAGRVARIRQATESGVDVARMNVALRQLRALTASNPAQLG